jgi:mono/diheme cytochrome c family protein
MKHMPGHAERLARIAALLGMACLGGSQARAEAIDFEAAVRPVLAKHCYECHGDGRRKGGLSLETEKDALQGGDSLHASYVAGKSAESLILQRVLETDPAKRMPPKGGPLDAAETAALRAWIDAGAHWGGARDAAPVAPAGSEHWAFQRPEQPAPPAVKDAAWTRNPIDAFVLAGIEGVGMRPTPEADRYTLARRLYLDLTGLPPSLAEVA